MRRHKSVETLFLNWWNKASTISDIKFKINNDNLVNYQDGNLFSKKCKLPHYKTFQTDKFLSKCDKFIDFAYFYEKTTGRNPQMVSDGFTLYQEVDYFLIICIMMLLRNHQIYIKIKKQEL